MNRRSFLKALVALPAVACVPFLPEPRSEFGPSPLAKFTPNDLVQLAGELKQGYQPTFYMSESAYAKIKVSGCLNPDARVVTL